MRAGRTEVMGKLADMDIVRRRRGRCWVYRNSQEIPSTTQTGGINEFCWCPLQVRLEHGTNPEEHIG